MEGGSGAARSELKGVEDFNEDEHNKKIILREKKRSGFSKWLRPFLDRSEEFNPPMLTNEEYRKLALENLETCMWMFGAPCWSILRRGPQPGDLIQDMNTEQWGRIYLLSGEVNCPASFLHNEFTNKFEDITQWNPTILVSKIIRKIDEDLDISYQVTAGAGGGIIKPRDFTNLRISARRNNRLLNCGVSIDYPGNPPTDMYTRGENKVGCWSVEPMSTKAGDPEKCLFQWLIGCDLKGWIPNYILEIAFPTAMSDFLHHLRVFAEKSHSNKLF